MTDENYRKLKERRQEIAKRGLTSNEDELNHIWNSYKEITGSKERRPCGCGSAGKHWQKALDVIDNYLKEHDTRDQQTTDDTIQ